MTASYTQAEHEVVPVVVYRVPIEDLRQIFHFPLVFPDSRSPSSLCVLPVVRIPAGLVPVQDGKDTWRAFADGGHDDVGSVEVAVREDERNVVREL